MQIGFDIPQCFCPGSIRPENAESLEVLLECLVSLNLVFLRFHRVPNLYRSGVIYGRTTLWDTIPAVLYRGEADCKSLSAWRIAELRHAGHLALPEFRFFSNDDGSTDYHIVVRTVNGNEDPSKECGMLDNENEPHEGVERPVPFQKVWYHG